MVDSFYVKDLFGFKISAASKQKTIEKRLRDAIRREKAYRVPTQTGIAAKLDQNESPYDLLDVL